LNFGLFRAKTGCKCYKNSKKTEGREDKEERGRVGVEQAVKFYPTFVSL
jgi:hypothetical protein